MQKMLRRILRLLEQNNVFLQTVNVTVGHFNLLNLDTIKLSASYNYQTDTILIPGWEHCLLFTERGKKFLYKSILHEYGHAFHNKVCFTLGNKFPLVFGDRSIEYPKLGAYTHLVTRNQPTFISAYAQTHPDEDFAETFKHVILTNRKAHSNNKTLQKKIKEINQLIDRHGAS